MSARFSATATSFYTGATSTVAPPFTAMNWHYLSVDRNVYSAAVSLVNPTHDLGEATDLTHPDGTNQYAFAYPGAISVGNNVQTVGVWYRSAITVSGTTVTHFWGTATGAFTTNTGTTSSTMAGLSLFYIGNDDYGEYLNGRVANVKVYSAVLTAAEIATELNSWTAIRTADLVRHHRLQVAETTDYSGNGHTLTGGSGVTTEADPPIVEPGRFLLAM